MVGLCGGYTTFSSLSLQTFDVAEDGDWLKAAANILFSLAGCLVAVWADTDEKMNTLLPALDEMMGSGLVKK